VKNSDCRQLRETVYYCVQKCSPLAPTLSQMNPIHASLLYLLNKVTFVHYLRLQSQLQSVPFVSGLPIKSLYACFLSTRATCPVHLIVPDLITQIIFGQSTHHDTPQYAELSIPSSSQAGTNINLSTLFSNTLVRTALFCAITQRVLLNSETSVRNYQYMLHNSPEQCSFQLPRGRSLMPQLTLRSQ
jgi:hypothetical protein